MLVFGNNCCAAYFYNYMNAQYNNPAIWCRILYDSMYYIITQYDNIDWFNYEIRKSIIKPNTFDIVIDNKFFINYSHYLQDLKCSSIVTTSKYDKAHKVHYMGDVKYCKIWEYVVQKYIDRCNRLLNTNEDPCFIIRDDEHLLSSTTRSVKHNILDIINVTSYKTIILTSNKSLTSSNINCKVIYTNMNLHPDDNIKHNLSNITSFFGLTIDC